MAKNKVDYSGFSQAVSLILEMYGNQVQEIVDRHSLEVAQKGAKLLRARSPKRTGAYTRSWKVDTEKTRVMNKYTIYNAKHYRLTHLLEYEHRIANKYGSYRYSDPSKTAHIAQVESEIIRDFESRIKEEINNI